MSKEKDVVERLSEMSKFKFTKSPWIAVGMQVETPDEKADICTVNPVLFGQGAKARPLSETIANAKLIAMAPALVSLLQDAYRVLEQCDVGEELRKEIDQVFKDLP